MIALWVLVIGPLLASALYVAWEVLIAPLVDDDEQPIEAP